MLLNKKKIKDSQQKLLKIVSRIEERSRLYQLGSGQTRLKIIFLLKLHKELCPSDFSHILKISMSAVSHQLGLLEKANLVKKMRMGKIICYTLSDKGREFFKILSFS